ncbi:amidohydrolase [Streptomyces formicae]|uniref:Exoenzymes regulatory protein AepA in lipid-linked oligosaccharide synthesis cluster n=1 Tax=Streptomyces formicae TaxID=1616117 RepID=A0A291Q1R6_9ACTN|nr:amidohydrolase [Streptomyces formicae]ATL25457.1 Exoenzymes regulatory protein AepA in lipid-linked oligosaccharide synthesis cluster [Streptomyces formicae]
MTATTLVFLGTIRTGSQPGDDTTALAVRDGRIHALGDAALALAADADEVVEVGDGLLMAAFGDGHAHPLFGGLESFGPRIKGLGSVADIVSEVGRWAKEHPAAEWIVGASYDPALAPDGEFDARWLDDAVADRPVVLRADDYHTVWCNTEALRRAGVTAATEEPRLGWIVRRPDGTPLGTLREWHACDLVLDQVPARAEDELVEALRRAGDTYARAGLTWVQDAWVEPEMVDAYLAAARRGALGFRVDLAQRADPDHWRAQRERFAATRARVAAEGGELLTARTVKYFSDGVVEGGTAAMLAPYLDAPHSCGMPVWEPRALAEAVRAFDTDGFQTHIHAIGDAGVRAALDAVESAIVTNPAWDRRPVITHVQVVDPADLPRFAALGVIANFEPLWAQPDPLQTELSIPRIGAERAALQYPMGHLARDGVRLSFGSDWPVSSHVPLEGIQVAVTRRTFAGEPEAGWLPHQRLTVEEALTAATAGVAHQAGADDRLTLAPGAPADLVLLSADPRAVDPMEIRHARVLGTWLGGRPTYRKDQQGRKDPS